MLVVKSESMNCAVHASFSGNSYIRTLLSSLHLNQRKKELNAIFNTFSICDIKYAVNGQNMSAFQYIYIYSASITFTGAFTSTVLHFFSFRFI